MAYLPDQGEAYTEGDEFVDGSEVRYARRGGEFDQAEMLEVDESEPVVVEESLEDGEEAELYDDDEDDESAGGLSRPRSDAAGALAGQGQPRTRRVAKYRYNIPDGIKNFLLYFQRQVRERNVYEIHSVYEVSWNKFTEKFFKSTPWPGVESIIPIVGEDPLFLTLYKELYFRHIYSKIGPTLNNRIESWRTYQELFNYILNSPSPVELDLPNLWVWDIIDEFIYQYQSACQNRTKPRAKFHADERRILSENPEVWSTHGVLHYLTALVAKSGIIGTLEREAKGTAAAAGEGGDEFSKHSLYKMLGYFSIIGLVRVHCMMCDYNLALRTLDPIDLTHKRGLFTRVTACHITLYYYLGFTYLMMRRYVDAIKTFTTILLYISRTKQYHTRSYQYESMIKKAEQMYGLLAIAVALCPQRIDENIHQVLREKYGERMTRMQRGDETAFSETFMFCCPKFVNPSPPDYTVDPPVNSQANETLQTQLRLFMQEVRQQVCIPIVRSYLKLYSTISIPKLAMFLEADDADTRGDSDAVRAYLACFKHKTHNLVWAGSSTTTAATHNNNNNANATVGSTPVSSGKVLSSSDVDFYVDGADMVHILDSKVVRRYGEFFIRNVNKFEEILKDIKSNTAAAAIAAAPSSSSSASSSSTQPAATSAATKA
eukprot:TRINITY_DN1252_c0_g1_i2.p1 TRINITY_DN1252_c0_g1~~TRINITY_DN1252_c0_g1_i2.p1  ORF type:complete len:658 (-),score=213.62 TRINITY_DN1252_c0_g1_i2:83-2056(-)